MKIMILGNMGYVGPSVIDQLRETYPGAELIGYDIGYFAHCLSNASQLPETKLDRQIFGDVRNFRADLLDGVDAVINLAGISNDPMGNKYEEVTMEINYRATVKI